MRNCFTFLLFSLVGNFVFATSVNIKEGNKLASMFMNEWAITNYDNLVINRDFNALAFMPFMKSANVAMMMGCPSQIDVQLLPGECSRVVNYDFSGFPDLADITLNTNPNINSGQINSTIYCSSGQTRYARTFNHGGATDLRVTSIHLGVYQSLNNPTVTFNFYTTSGLLLGTYSTSVPNINLGIHTVNIPNGVDIKIPALSSYVMEVVSNAPHISVFKIGRNHLGNAVGFSEASIVATDCGQILNTEIDPAFSNITPNSVVFGVKGLLDDYKIVNTSNGYNSGDEFPIGSHQMVYTIANATGAPLVGVPTNCAFSINVTGYQPASSTLACNDLVQISLDDECEMIVTPQMLLEGTLYGCYDSYTVQIIGNNGVNLGNKVTRANIGQTLTTQVFSSNGNSCWGKILVQDKFGPDLVCHDIYATCSTDLTPGSPLSPRVPVSAIISTPTISSGAPSSFSYIIPVANLDNTTVTDLNVFLDISHTKISDLAVNITSPDGVTVPLMILSTSSCPNPNLMVTLDDSASANHSAMVNTCELTDPALTGNFRPFNPLSIFNGKPLNGNWVVTVYDLQATNGGKVNHIDLIFSQTGGSIPFPTPKDVTATIVSDNIFQVRGIDNCGTATLSYTDTVVEEDCSSIYSKVIKRCWLGKDDKNNPANECCQFIYVYRNGLSTLQFPPNFDGIGSNPEPLSCFEYGDTIPSTLVTGLPFGDLCYNVQIAEPTDIRIDICENSYKLIRTHKVIEWCSGQVIVHNQIIKVIDDQGPELDCPDNVTISTDDYDCSATYKVPRPTIIDECSSEVYYELSYNSHNTFDEDYIDDNVNQNTSTIKGLPLGQSWIKWEVTDACGNVSTCTFQVTVVDRVLPNAVCDRTTVAAISGNGIAVVEAFTFDDGSVDNCGILRYEARKMVDICTNQISVFGPEVRFCCSEVNTTVMVEFRVTDLSGNSNTCMVEVQVQDKLPPYITKCPADITLDCQADYNDLKVTGEPVYVDNCEVISVKSQDKVVINQCGVGTVTRTWTVEDKQGFKNSCVQVITLINDDPFYYNINNENDPRNDIKWPANYTTKKCHSVLDPSSLPVGFDRPTFNDDNCSLVASHYKDQVFKFVDGACEKVLRTWTVIDWCTYNDANPVYGQGWYEKTQIIKLQNDIAPNFEFACVDRTFATYGNCEGPVDFTMTAVDDCPENNTNLTWKYELFTETGVTPYAVVNSDRFLRTMAVGKYKIRWTVEDKCGNRAFCTHLIDVIESKKPTPYCLSSITTAVMNSNGTISIWAKDYDLGASDNCTAKNDLIFTFYGATPVDSLITKPHYFYGDGVLGTLAQYNAGVAQSWIPEKRTSGILFDCLDIPNGVSQEVSVEIWVSDLAGNQDYCTVVLVLQDNSNVCPNSNTNLIAINGRAATSQSVGLNSAEVRLSSSAPEQNKTIKVDATGSYALANLPKNNTYTVSMYDNSNLLNGVSTLDLVLIQRHILGLEQFSDATKVIAGDVDNNGKVTAADLTALRKNILGITTEFGNGQTSWRFVTSNHVFTSPTSPFPYTEKYVYNQLVDNKVNQNFIGIKIGDVNKSAIINAKESGVENRSSKSLELETKLSDAVVGQEISIPIYAKDFDGIFGYQFTLGFDPNAIEVTDITANTLNISDANFGMHRLFEGFITTSWSNDTPVNVSSDEPLFTITCTAKEDLKSKQLFNVSSFITPAAAFDVDYQVMNVSLGNRSQHEGSYELMQNKPNPFQDKTSISFRLPISGSATLRIFDMNGKVLKVIKGEYIKGEHTIQLDKSELGTSGILMYQIESGTFTATKKMIIIE